MPYVLVIGGAGYIGSHTCKALSQAGLTPVTYDNLTRGHEWAVKWGPLEQGDILDGNRLGSVIEKYQTAAVIHFATFTYVGESIAYPAKYYRNNVVGTLTLLDTMRVHGLDRLVFSSSAAIYGVPDVVPIPEHASQTPVNPYGASKRMLETILADYRTAYGLKSIALRYFNAAGADPDGEIGEDHSPETHLIPLVLRTAVGARPNIAIFGSDYATPDGTCVRDYVHVSDLADAHVCALGLLDSDKARPAYNLGNGEGTSVADVIETAKTVTRQNIDVVQGARRPGDPATLVADPSLAIKELGWRPRLTDLSSIIETAWRWHVNKHFGGEARMNALTRGEFVE